MNQGNSRRRNPHLISLSHLERIFYTSLRLTKNGQEAVRLMQDAIGRLPVEYRLVFILSYLEGFLPQEIADLAGAEPQAVSAMLQRGRELIRKEFLKPQPGGGTLGMSIKGVSDGGTEWTNSGAKDRHACGQMVCCKRHHRFPDE